MSELGAGARLGSYRLLLPIGTGGMGRVWAALDESSDSPHIVAVKLALEEGADTKYWSALADEAAVASSIRHPNVCRSLGLGVSGNVRYLVMELSDGASLRDWLDALPVPRLPPTIAVQIGVKVAAGLQAAHELVGDDGVPLGVVHRDVSPQNVLIDRRGRVRLADFGVAKARGQLRRPTETGEIKGKLGYMAPEQITSKSVDARADVFALGAVLYEATLGVRAFHGADALTTMYAILEQPVRAPHEIDPSFPRRLEAVLLKALEKRVEDRFQSAAELQVALAACLDADLTSPGDRRTARALSDALDDVLEKRHLALLDAAERVKRGEPLEQAEAKAGLGSVSTTEVAVALSNEQVPVVRRNRTWLGIALAGSLCLGVGWHLRAKPSNSAAAHTELTAAASNLTPAAALVPSAEMVPPPSSSASKEDATAAKPPPKRVQGKSRSVGSKNAAPTPMEPVAASVAMPSARAAKAKPPRVIDQSNPFSD